MTDSDPNQIDGEGVGGDGMPNVDLPDVDQIVC